jgi:hypothetical protein
MKMAERSWAVVVQIVHERADYCCEYCRTCQKVCGQAMHVDHINPESGDELDNLCLASPTCNLSKSNAISGIDPLSQQETPLFNPRNQVWLEHFEWQENGALINGMTPIGRATIERLQMNIERNVTSRRIWILAKAHPPSDLT